MNQIFSFSRWWLLVQKHWTENRKRYLLALVAMGGLLAAWYGFLLTMESRYALNPGDQFAAYYFGLYFIGCLYGSTVFAGLGSRPSGIDYLSLPASQFEKLFCGLFFSVLLFFIAYTLVFYIVDIPFVQLRNQWVARHNPLLPKDENPIPSVTVYNVFTAVDGPIPERLYHLFMLVYFPLQAAFILGSVYFTRYSFIKTIVAVLLFILASVLFVTKGIEDHLPAGWRADGLLEWGQFNAVRGQVKMVRLSGGMEWILGFVVRYSGAFIFWFITYVRLKEKEV